jgi:hypothetical protein
MSNNPPKPDAKPLNGTDFVATRDLFDKPGKVLAKAGETCEKVPAQSLGWLLKDGWIEPATPEARERLRLTRTRRTRKKAKADNA